VADERDEPVNGGEGEDSLVMRVMTSLTLAAVLMLVALGGWAWVHRPRSAPDLTTGGPGAQVFDQAGGGQAGQDHASGGDPSDPSSLNRDEKARRLFGGMKRD